MSAIKFEQLYLVKLQYKQQHLENLQQQQEQQHVEPTFNDHWNLLNLFYNQNNSNKTSKRPNACSNYNNSNYSYINYCSTSFIYFKLNQHLFDFYHFCFCILYPAAVAACVAHFKYFTTNYVKSYCHIKRHGVNNNKTLCWLTLTLILLSGIWNTPNNGLVLCHAFDIGKY